MFYPLWQYMTLKSHVFDRTAHIIKSLTHPTLETFISKSYQNILKPIVYEWLLGFAESSMIQPLAIAVLAGRSFASSVPMSPATWPPQKPTGLDLTLENGLFNQKWLGNLIWCHQMTLLQAHCYCFKRSSAWRLHQVSSRADHRWDQTVRVQIAPWRCWTKLGPRPPTADILGCLMVSDKVCFNMFQPIRRLEFEKFLPVEIGQTFQTCSNWLQFPVLLFTGVLKREGVEFQANCLMYGYMVGETYWRSTTWIIACSIDSTITISPTGALRVFDVHCAEQIVHCILCWLNMTEQHEKIRQQVGGFVLHRTMACSDTLQEIIVVGVAAVNILAASRVRYLRLLI